MFTECTCPSKNGDRGCYQGTQSTDTCPLLLRIEVLEKSLDRVSAASIALVVKDPELEEDDKDKSKRKEELSKSIDEAERILN